MLSSCLLWCGWLMTPSVTAGPCGNTLGQDILTGVILPGVDRDGISPEFVSWDLDGMIFFLWEWDGRVSPSNSHFSFSKNSVTEAWLRNPFKSLWSLLNIQHISLYLLETNHCHVRLCSVFLLIIILNAQQGRIDTQPSRGWSPGAYTRKGAQEPTLERGPTGCKEIIFS